MATSGDYRNYFQHGDSLYSHEIDPRTGRSIQNGVASVTVLAPSCMLADAMATAIMIMGADEGMKCVEAKTSSEIRYDPCGAKSSLFRVGNTILTNCHRIRLSKNFITVAHSLRYLKNR